MMVNISVPTVFLRRSDAFGAALSPYIKKQTTLTYRGDKSTSKYQFNKKFPGHKITSKSGTHKTSEVFLGLIIKTYKNFRSKKMGVKWIHKGGYSRPDKRTIKKGGGKKK
jgi:hypothetical protein